MLFGYLQAQVCQDSFDISCEVIDLRTLLPWDAAAVGKLPCRSGLPCNSSRMLHHWGNPRCYFRGNLCGCITGLVLGLCVDSLLLGTNLAVSLLVVTHC